MEKVWEQQQKDIRFQELREILENGCTQEKKNCFPFNVKNTRIDGGLITEKNKNILMLVPETFAGLLTTTLHEELCHIGVRKLFHYMEKIFYWPKMQETIQLCLRCCEICAKRKIDQTRTKETFIPRYSSEFLEQIVIDVVYMEINTIKIYGSNGGPF